MERRDVGTPPPDRLALDESIKKLRCLIDELQGKLEALNERDSRNSFADQCRDERRQIQQSLDVLRSDIDEHKKEQSQRRARIGEIDETKRELRKRNQDMSKNTPTTVADIDAEIKRLEWKLETEGSSSVKREKAAMSEIARLKAAKSSVKERDELHLEQGNLDEQRKRLLDQVLDIQKEIDRIRGDRDVIYQQLQEITNKQNEGKDAINNVRKERQALRDEIQVHYEHIRKLRDDFSAQMEQWKKKREEEKEKERVRREAERNAREEKRAKLEEERRAKYEERARAQKEFSRLKKLNPHVEEIATCDILIAYLSADSKEHEKKRVVAEFDANAFAKKGMKELKKGQAEEDAWLMGKKKDKSKPKPAAPAAAAAAAPIPKPKADRKMPALTVSKMQGFDKVGIQPPLRSSDVPACLDQLKAKKAHFESFRRTPEQLDREEEEEERRAKEAQVQRQREEREARSREVEEAAAEEAAVVAAAVAGAELEGTAEEEAEEEEDADEAEEEEDADESEEEEDDVEALAKEEAAALQAAADEAEEFAAATAAAAAALSETEAEAAFASEELVAVEATALQTTADETEEFAAIEDEEVADSGAEGEEESQEVVDTDTPGTLVGPPPIDEE